MTKRKQPEAALDALRQAKHDADEAKRQADEQVRDAVDAARSQGATWQAIGDSLGLPRQVVWRKYGPEAQRTGTDGWSAVLVSASTGKRFLKVSTSDTATMIHLATPGPADEERSNLVAGEWWRNYTICKGTLYWRDAATRDIEYYKARHEDGGIMRLRPVREGTRRDVRCSKCNVYLPDDVDWPDTEWRSAEVEEADRIKEAEAVEAFERYMHQHRRPR